MRDLLCHAWQGKKKDGGLAELIKKSMQKEKTHKHNVHAIFECLQCGWRDEEYAKARKRGYEHAKKTGHSVRGEIGRAFHYNQ